MHLHLRRTAAGRADRSCMIEASQAQMPSATAPESLKPNTRCAAPTGGYVGTSCSLSLLEKEGSEKGHHCLLDTSPEAGTSRQDTTGEWLRKKKSEWEKKSGLFRPAMPLIQRCKPALHMSYLGREELGLRGLGGSGIELLRACSDGGCKRNSIWRAITEILNRLLRMRGDITTQVCKVGRGDAEVSHHMCLFTCVPMLILRSHALVVSCMVVSST